MTEPPASHDGSSFGRHAAARMGVGSRGCVLAAGRPRSALFVGRKASRPFTLALLRLSAVRAAVGRSTSCYARAFERGPSRGSFFAWSSPWRCPSCSRSSSSSTAGPRSSASRRRSRCAFPTVRASSANQQLGSARTSPTSTPASSFPRALSSPIERRPPCGGRLRVASVALRAVSRIFAYAVINFTLGMLLTAYLRRFGQNRVRLLRTQVGLFVAIFLLDDGGQAAACSSPRSRSSGSRWRRCRCGSRSSFDRRTAFLVELVLAFIASSLPPLRS